MSGNTKAPAANASKQAETKNGDTKENPQKPATQLEEDDEFEDFPVEDWAEEETQLPGGNAHLWEESWDDDDTSEDFAILLREELKKVSKQG